MRRASITYGVTSQVLELYPPEWPEGVPSSATFSIWEGAAGDDDDVEFSGSCTVDSVSIALDGSAGESQHAAAGGRRRIPLANTTDVVQGRDYLIANAEGQRERVRVTAISSGAYVEVEHDLAYDYITTTSSLYGLRVTAAVDDTFAATEAALNYPESPYRVLWTYTVAGVVRRHWTQFDLVRAAKKHGVTVDDLLGEHPQYLYQMGAEERLTGARRLLDAAWDRVLYDLDVVGIDPNSLRDGGKLDMLVKEAALMTAGDRGEAPPGRDSEQWGRERAAIYKRDLEKAISGNKLIVSQSLGGEITADPVRPGWFSS